MDMKEERIIDDLVEENKKLCEILKFAVRESGHGFNCGYKFGKDCDCWIERAVKALENKS